MSPPLSSTPIPSAVEEVPLPQKRNCMFHICALLSESSSKPILLVKPLPGVPFAPRIVKQQYCAPSVLPPKQATPLSPPWQLEAENAGLKARLEKLEQVLHAMHGGAR